MKSIRQAVIAAASLLTVLAAVPPVAEAEDQPPPESSKADTEEKKKGEHNSESRRERREKRREERGQDAKGEKSEESAFGKNQNPSGNPRAGGSSDGDMGGFGKKKQQTLDKADDDNGKDASQPDASSKKRKFGDQDNGQPVDKAGEPDTNKPNNKFGDHKRDHKFGDGDIDKPDLKKQSGSDQDGGAAGKPVVINPEPLNKETTDGGAPSDNSFSAGSARKRFENMKRGRRERRIDGGRGIVIEEPGKRTIFKENNKLVIQHDETERLRRGNPNARFEKGKDGTTISIIERPGNVRIYSETDENGQLLRRYRRWPDGREVIIIDNRRRHRGGTGKGLATGIGIGIGVVAGAAILNSMIDVPEPRVRIPREKYIVDYDRASDEEVYEALSAPPVEELDDRYTLDEIRATSRLRDRMRRVDLGDITFEFGSWEVDPSQYGKLERIARAMRRVIDRNSNEVFLVEGYTDAVGTPEDNLSLSDRRAESVAEVLSDQFNVPFENLTTQGYGEEYLKIETSGPERLNRRVAVRRITPLMSKNNGAPAARRGDYERSGGGDPDDRADRERDGADGPDAAYGRDDRDQGGQDLGDQDAGDRDQGRRGSYQYRPYQGEQHN